MKYILYTTNFRNNKIISYYINMVIYNMINIFNNSTNGLTPPPNGSNLSYEFYFHISGCC